MKDQRNKSSAREGEGVNHRGCGTEVVGSFVEGGRGLSKFLCTCGHTIRDQSDFLSFKGRILKDFDEHAFMGALSRECEALVNAVAAGDREAWLRRHFLESYPRDLSHGSVVHDYFNGLFVEHLVTVYECEECGRLWVQRSVSDNQFVAFVP